MLRAVGLRKAYGDFVALHDLHLQVDPGHIYCLLGANGAGKTTTIQLFLGFIEPTAGQRFIGDLDVSRAALESKRLIAYIPENVMLYPHLTGLENLRYFHALGGGVALDEGALRGLLVRAGLPEGAMTRRVGAYSKGMRQKVGIAMAMAKNARALLLDEPTSGLDPKASNEFSRLLETLRDDGVAILMATHDLFRSKEVGTHVGIMKHGRLVAEIRAADVSHTDLERLYLEHMHD